MMQVCWTFEPRRSTSSTSSSCGTPSPLFEINNNCNKENVNNFQHGSNIITPTVTGALVLDLPIIVGKVVVDVLVVKIMKEGGGGVGVCRGCGR